MTLFAGFFAVILLGLLACGPAVPLHRNKRHARDSPASNYLINSAEGCKLRSRTLNAQKVNWTRLTGKNITSIHNTSFTIFYCSGQCRHHDIRKRHATIQDEYVLQMHNLVKSCKDNNMNCDDLTPCCVPKRFETGRSAKHALRLDFNTTTVLLMYYRNEQDDYITYNHTFLNPHVCHCQ